MKRPSRQRQLCVGIVNDVLWVFHARHALYLAVKALRRASFWLYTTAVGWELALQEDELSEDLT